MALRQMHDGRSDDKVDGNADGGTRGGDAYACSSCQTNRQQKASGDADEEDDDGTSIHSLARHTLDVTSPASILVSLRNANNAKAEAADEDTRGEDSSSPGRDVRNMACDTEAGAPCLAPCLAHSLPSADPHVRAVSAVHRLIAERQTRKRALSDAEEALGAARGCVSAAKEDEREIELSIERLREAREAKRARYDEKKASVEAQMKEMRVRVRGFNVARDADDRHFSARSVEVGVHAREVRAEVELARAEMETCRRAFDDAYKAYKAHEEGVAQCTGVETSAASGGTQEWDVHAWRDMLFEYMGC